MGRTLESLSLAQARRIALAAQGFADKPPKGRPDARALQRVFNRVGIVQIDSVNVLVRSHYLPLFSRLGLYAPSLLERAAYRRPQRLFEYWAHEASLVPVRFHQFLRWRMARARNDAWGRMRQLAEQRPEFLQRVLEVLTENGPATAGEVERLLAGGASAVRRNGPWWDWREAKVALEFLFWSGEVTAAHRRGFERVYDLTERVIPSTVLATPTPDPVAARRELVRLSAQALGVGTEADLRDYFRLKPAQARDALHELVEAGDLTPVSVEGWRGVSYLAVGARVPRGVDVSALLSPFDSLVWFRPRVERLWNFRYRLEIYTPAHKRVHGYYVLPFLWGDRLVARVDLKADRRNGVLVTHAAHAEEGYAAAGPAALIAEPVALQLRGLASWLGLSGVVGPRAGDLAPAVCAALASG